MNIKECWSVYDYYTSEITKHARYLGFAGLAVCWFFRTPEITFPTPILISMVFLVLFFLADLAQYYVAALTRRSWIEGEEAQAAQNGIELDDLNIWPPKELDKTPYALFHTKLVLLLIGFLLIGGEMLSRVATP